MAQTIRSLFAVSRLLIGVGLLVYLGRSGVISWPRLLSLFAAWPISLLVLFLLLVVIGLTSWRLCLFLKPRDLHLSLGSSMRLTLIGAFFNTFLPGTAGGDVVRIYYAVGGNPGRRIEIATIILLDRLAGIFAMLAWPLLAAPLFPSLLGSAGTLRLLLWVAAMLAAGIAAGLLICFATRVAQTRVGSWMVLRLPLGDYLKRVFDAVRAYRHNGSTLLAVVGISLLVQTVMVAVMLLLVHATSPVGASWPMALLIPLGFLINTLPLTPGGLGVGEVGFDRLFKLAGLAGGAEALLAWRVLTTFIDVFGLVFYIKGHAWNAGRLGIDAQNY